MGRKRISVTTGLPPRKIRGSRSNHPETLATTGMGFTVKHCQTCGREMHIPAKAAHKMRYCDSCTRAHNAEVRATGGYREVVVVKNRTQGRGIVKRKRVNTLPTTRQVLTQERGEKLGGKVLRVYRIDFGRSPEDGRYLGQRIVYAYTMGEARDWARNLDPAGRKSSVRWSVQCEGAAPAGVKPGPKTSTL